MRKKSHISLARHLVKCRGAEALEAHKIAFYIGSILPDCKLSFLMRKHEFTGTFEALQENIKSLSSDYELFLTNGRAYCRRLGEVIHYIADYFTFPHNGHYNGSLKQHCKYEKHLKWRLKDYIRQNTSFLETHSFSNVQELFEYIINMHEEYRKRQGNLQKDCEYIVRLCQVVVMGILSLLIGGSASLPAVA